MRKSPIILVVALYCTSVYASVLPPPRPQDLLYSSPERPDAIPGNFGQEAVAHPLPPRRTGAMHDALSVIGPDDIIEASETIRSRNELALLADVINMAARREPVLDLFDAQVHMIELERAIFWGQLSTTQSDSNENQDIHLQCNFICIGQGSFLDRVLQ